MAANAPLELSTIAPERDRARLRTEANPEGLRPDGELYELLSPNELSLLQLHALEKEQAAISKLWEKDPAKAEAAMNTLVGMVILDAPADDIAALPFMVKANLMRVFSEALTGQLTTVATVNGKASEG